MSDALVGKDTALIHRGEIDMLASEMAATYKREQKKNSQRAVGGTPGRRPIVN